MALRNAYGWQNGAGVTIAIRNSDGAAEIADPVSISWRNLTRPVIWKPHAETDMPRRMPCIDRVALEQNRHGRRDICRNAAGAFQQVAAALEIGIAPTLNPPILGFFPCCHRHGFRESIIEIRYL